MFKLTMLCLLTTATGCLGACSSTPSLVFGQSHSVGISVGGSTTDAGGEISIGYKDRDVAVVPVAIVAKDGAVNADTMRVHSTVGGNATDALSVLGQFNVNSKASAPEVGLGKFFATGLAAQKLADGFACKLSGATSCSPEEEPPEQPVTPTASR